MRRFIDSLKFFPHLLGFVFIVICMWLTRGMRER